MDNEKSDAALKILIEFGLDEGKANQALQKIGEVKAAGSDMAAKPEGWEAFEKYKGVLKETAGESVSTREATHLMHLTMRNMGVDIPGFSMLMRGLFNPATAGLVVCNIW